MKNRHCTNDVDEFVLAKSKSCFIYIETGIWMFVFGLIIQKSFSCVMFYERIDVLMNVC